MAQKVLKKNLIIFGLIWSVIFFVIGLYPLKEGNDIRIWSIAISFSIIAIVLIQPGFLTLFYSSWIKIGELIGGIISKAIMFILFVCIFTPISLFLKLLKKDLLKKNMNTNDKTYWIIRDSQPQSMKNQF